MTISRRTAVAALAALPLAAQASPDKKEPAPMYGLIGKMRAQPGQRDALIAILLEGTAAMPGCLSYGIAKDKLDADALWITETWDSQASHKASLSLPSVQAAIAKGRPLIAGFGERFETEPVGGHGMMARQRS
ncbi:putative quinol monooxygenase [Massilia consociata]|uniref:Quinol monooxygenase n=1 Tax=Massilia consociata TaxID=760117 RepID=A0ABV6FAU6_9BURK